MTKQLIKVCGFDDSEYSEDFYTIPKAAKKLGIHQHTLRNWVKKGLVPGAKVGGLTRISSLAILKLIQDFRTKISQKSLINLHQYNEICLELATSFLEVDKEELEKANIELEDLYHIDFEPDFSKENQSNYSILVCGHEHPGNYTARVFKNMLHPRTLNKCLHCLSSVRILDFKEKNMRTLTKDGFVYICQSFTCHHCKKQAHLIKIKLKKKTMLGRIKGIEIKTEKTT